MADLTGKTLGKYRLMERLGRGGMAEVYRAYQPGLDRYVAVKLMHGYLAEDEDFVGRFQREAKAIAALRHPHIVQVHDFDIEDDVYYMVQEYVEGGTLKARLKKANQEAKPFSIQETVRILTAICGAVEYAHQRGRVHRDIKPDNIMFGEDDRPVLTDFGIASIVGGARFTATGAMVGTPAYMSPEQGKGYPGDARSDVYSLGVVLYEMVTGRIPFDADTPFAVILKHVNEPLPMPRSLNHDVPFEIERIILKALAKEPDDRYQTAGELAQALEETIQERDMPGWDIPLVETTLPAAEPPPIDDMVLEEGTSPAKTPAPEPGKQAPARKRKWWVWALGGVAALMLISCCLVVGLRVLKNTRDRRATTTQTPIPREDRREAAATAPMDAEPTAAVASPAQDLIRAGYEALGEQCEGDGDTALSLFEQAIEQAPNAAAAYVGRARYAICQGEDQQALADLDKAIELDPDFAAAYLARGRMRYQEEQGQEAVDDLTRAIELDPQYVEAYFYRGRTYEWPLEDYDRALEDMDKVIELDPDFAEAYLRRGQLYLWNMEDPEAALADYAKVVELWPESARGYSEQGYVYLDVLHEYDKAVTEYTLAIEREPTEGSLYFYRALAHWELEDMNAAIKDLDQALEIDPTASRYFYRGMARYDDGQYDAALEDFDKVLLLGWDEEGAAHHGQGWVFFELGEYEKAIAAYDRAAEYDFEYYRWPFFGDTHLLLDRAIAYRTNEQFEEALSDLNKLIEDYDSWAAAYFQRGLTYAALGGAQEALQDLRQAWEYTDDAELRAEIEAAMQKVQTE